jgi:hypothetical protein
MFLYAQLPHTQLFPLFYAQAGQGLFFLHICPLGLLGNLEGPHGTGPDALRKLVNSLFFEPFVH